jgi:hypothetical protein
VPTVLIAVPHEFALHLEQSFFWRADMRRTNATPAEVFNVARTLGPDVIIVMPAGDGAAEVLDSLRREPVTRDSIVVVLSDHPDQAASLEAKGANLVLPPNFSASGEDAPWHRKLEELLRLRQRRESRVIAEFPVDLWLTQGGARRQVKAQGLNLSSRGILIETPDVLPLQARVDLQFTAGKGLPEVSVVGEVVRGAETADKRHLAGVHFVVVRKDARIAVRDTLRALRPEGQETEA